MLLPTGAATFRVEELGSRGGLLLPAPEKEDDDECEPDDDDDEEGDPKIAAFVLAEKPPTLCLLPLRIA